jgi:hypothetical protein
MGEVIALQLAANSKRAQMKNPGEDAQILFFTGVRYVQAAEAVSEPAMPSHDDGNPRGGKRRRAR